MHDNLYMLKLMQWKTKGLPQPCLVSQWQNQKIFEFQTPAVLKNKS